jgi:NADH-quinone oxidoreductase subunit J
MMNLFTTGVDHSAQIGFYALAAVAIFASLRVVMHPNPVHAILSMIVSLLAVSGIFFILGAPFAGALEIIVYAGAILVLFVFVIMMLNLGMANDARERRWLSAQTWAVPTGLTIVIAVVLFSMIALGTNPQTTLADGNVAPALIGTSTVSPKVVGISLFSEYLMLVEVAALLLLAALVAAYHLGKKALDDENLSQSSRNYQPEAGQVIEYEDGDVTDAVQQAKPYEYQPVNAQDYVSAANAQRTARKELD